VKSPAYSEPPRATLERRELFCTREKEKEKLRELKRTSANNDRKRLIIFISLCGAVGETGALTPSDVPGKSYSS